MSTETRCPACGALTGFRRSRTQGLWEKVLAKLIGLKAYRCEACARRVLRRWLPVARDQHRHERPVRLADSSEQGSDEFDELIREIAAAEHRKSAQEREAK